MVQLQLADRQGSLRGSSDPSRTSRSADDGRLPVVVERFGRPCPELGDTQPRKRTFVTLDTLGVAGCVGGSAVVGQVVFEIDGFDSSCDGILENAVDVLLV